MLHPVSQPASAAAASDVLHSSARENLCGYSLFVLTLKSWEPLSGSTVFGLEDTELILGFVHKGAIGLCAQKAILG